MAISTAAKEFNAQLRRVNGVKFQVIETATGRAVANGASYPYGFAKYVRDIRDIFGEGAFLIKRCN